MSATFSCHSCFPGNGTTRERKDNQRVTRHRARICVAHSGAELLFIAVRTKPTPVSVTQTKYLARQKACASVLQQVPRQSRARSAVGHPAAATGKLALRRKQYRANDQSSGTRAPNTRDLITALEACVQDEQRCSSLLKRRAVFDPAALHIHIPLDRQGYKITGHAAVPEQRRHTARVNVLATSSHVQAPDRRRQGATLGDRGR